MAVTIVKGGKITASETVKKHIGVATHEVVHKSGAVTSGQTNLEPGIVTQVPMATVGLSMGRTFNLGNYESAKVNVTVTLPSLPDTASMDTAFADAMKWVDAKLCDLQQEVEGSREG